MREIIRLENHRLGQTAKAFQKERFEVEPCVLGDAAEC